MTESRCWSMALVVRFTCSPPYLEDEGGWRHSVIGGDNSPIALHCRSCHFVIPYSVAAVADCLSTRFRPERGQVVGGTPQCGKARKTISVPPGVRKMNVLVVEDETISREAIAHTLREAGYCVTTAL